MVKKLVGTLVVALLALGTSAHAGVAPASMCKDVKAKETGKKALGLLKAFGKNAKVPNTAKLTTDISKAQSKFSKGFTKAEFTGAGASKGCGIIEDADDIEAKVDALVLDVLDELAQPPAGPVEVMGALTATIGRFNYNLSTGLPGANAACNTNFPGTHACTYAELQIGEAAGDLVGLKDTASNTVTSLLGDRQLDNSDLKQCNDDEPRRGFRCPGRTGSTGRRTPHRAARRWLSTTAPGTSGRSRRRQQCNFTSQLGRLLSVKNPASPARACRRRRLSTRRRSPLLPLVPGPAFPSPAGTAPPCSAPGTGWCVARRFAGSVPRGELGFRFGEPLDVDGDGHADIAAGARFKLQQGTLQNGSAAVWSGANGAPIRAWDGEWPDGLFGHWVMPVPDLSGDGLADVIIAAPHRAGRRARARHRGGALSEDRRGASGRARRPRARTSAGT